MTITSEQLHELADTVQAAPAAPGTHRNGTAPPLTDILDAAGISYRPQPPDANGITWYHLDSPSCPFHEDDGLHRCGVGQKLPDGPFAAKCFHNRGEGKGWQEFKATLSLNMGHNGATPGHNAGYGSDRSQTDGGADSRAEPVVLHSLDEVIATFRRWIYLPDPAPLIVALATYLANRLPGDPLWLLVIGPSGDGKTTILQAFTDLSDVHFASVLTEAALLSGTPKREQQHGARGGLLRVIGDYGILIAKDFTSVLAMNRDTRAALLAALREIFDGRWDRHVGTDGGRTLSWTGKLGFLAGVTPAIDAHHGVMATMGQRFVCIRTSTDNAEQQALRAMQQVGREEAMRRELATALRGFLEPLTSTDPFPALADIDAAQLVALGQLVARARSAVERESGSHDITLIPAAEAPTRLAQALRKLLLCMERLGVDEPERWRILNRVARDTIPEPRQGALLALGAAGDAATTTDIAIAIRHPTATTRRTLEDLAAHGVAVRVAAAGNGKADRWHVADWARGTVSLLSVHMRKARSNGGEQDATSRTPTDIWETPEPRGCWRCKAALDTEDAERCDGCGWYRCPTCGACGPECEAPSTTPPACWVRNCPNAATFSAPNGSNWCADHGSDEPPE